jgi:hypothetical protein
VPRVTERINPCVCKKRWADFSPTRPSFFCSDFCCTYDRKSINGTDFDLLPEDEKKKYIVPWCKTENPECEKVTTVVDESTGETKTESRDWGFCKSNFDTSTEIAVAGSLAGSNLDSAGIPGIYPTCVRLLPEENSNVVIDEISDPCRYEFTYFKEAYVDFVTPPSGPNMGGSLITLHTRNVPRLLNGNSILCRFESYVGVGRWITENEVSCVTPNVFFTFEQFEVQVYLSINGGSDWITSENVTFTFMPSANILNIEPDFGPQQGGTAVFITMPSYYNNASATYEPSACCFGE